MEASDIRVGQRVKISHLTGTAGMIVDWGNLAIRKAGMTGIITGFVAGHDRDVWWVRHDDHSGIGAYWPKEFNLIP